MGMQVQLLAPGVEHGQHADARAQVFGIGGNLQQGLRGTTKQQVVDEPGVAQGQRVELFRQGEDDMEVGDRQQLFAALLQPARLLQSLTFWTVTVAAGVVNDFLRPAVDTLVDMPAQGGWERESSCLDSNDLLPCLSLSVMLSDRESTDKLRGLAGL